MASGMGMGNPATRLERQVIRVRAAACDVGAKLCIICGSRQFHGLQARWTTETQRDADGERGFALIMRSALR